MSQIKLKIKIFLLKFFDENVYKFNSLLGLFKPLHQFRISKQKIIKIYKIKLISYFSV